MSPSSAEELEHIVHRSGGREPEQSKIKLQMQVLNGFRVMGSVQLKTDLGKGRIIRLETGASGNFLTYSSSSLTKISLDGKVNTTNLEGRDRSEHSSRLKRYQRLPIQYINHTASHSNFTLSTVNIQDSSPNNVPLIISSVNGQA